MTSSAAAAAIGTANTVPLLARTTFGLPQSATGEAAITASTPAASAVRSMAPRLPGFSTASQTSTTGGCRRSGASTASRSVRVRVGVRDDGQPAVRRLPVRRLGERGPAQRHDLRAGRARLGPARGRSARRPARGRSPAAGAATPASSARRELGVPLDDRDPLLVADAATAQRLQPLHPGVGRAGDVHRPAVGGVHALQSSADGRGDDAAGLPGAATPYLGWRPCACTWSGTDAPAVGPGDAGLHLGAGPVGVRRASTGCAPPACCRRTRPSGSARPSPRPSRPRPG